MSDLFKTHLLTPDAARKAKQVGESFDSLLTFVAANCPEGRELSLAKTHMEQACTWAKKAIARQPVNQAEVVPVEAKARAAFAAYNAEGPNPNKTFDGREVPPWEGLNDAVRGKWLAAAKALAVLVLFLPALAFAGEGASAPMTAGEFVVSILPGVFTLLSLVLIKFLFPMLTTWLTAMAQTSKVAAVALKVEHFAETVVADLDATMRPEVALALADGVLDDSEKQKLRALALDRMKVLLGTAGLAEVGGVLGIGAAAVESYLVGVVEKKVDQKNNAATAAISGLSPKPA